MGREEARIILRQEPHAPAANDEQHHCILCDAVILYPDHDVFFATSRCRCCHEALEGE